MKEFASVHPPAAKNSNRTSRECARQTSQVFDQSEGTNNRFSGTQLGPDLAKLGKVVTIIRRERKARGREMKIQVQKMRERQRWSHTHQQVREEWMTKG